MTTATLRNALGLGERAPLDRLLRFAAPVQELYDRDHAGERVSELRSAILVGLIFYNVYNITSIVLLADCLVLSVALRVGLITSTSLGLIWLITWTSPQWTERLVTVGIVNAYAVPLYLFWTTQGSFGLFTFGELQLTIIFANLLLALRFPNALIFNAVALGLTLLAVAAKPSVDTPLRFVFAVQSATACAFGLYANYRLERRRCLDFMKALAATLQAERARADRQVFEDLSRTDALTHLPNRRHLTEQLEGWLSERRTLAVMMIDIDHFKLYNDALGHAAGDDCLQRVADAFARITRDTPESFCARFGGEEFTFAVVCEREIEAARVARALVQAVAMLQIPHPARSDGIGIVTVSVGGVRWGPAAGGSLGDLLAAADRALYAAKRRGRNRFVLDEEADRSMPPASLHAALARPARTRRSGNAPSVISFGRTGVRPAAP